jgi:5-methylcytosine-specific restriction endonuclease McrA
MVKKIVREQSEIDALRRLPYQQYLRSRHWLVYRAIHLKAVGGRCQACNAPGPLQLHHRTYQNLGAEKWFDCTALCESCHDLFHRHGKLSSG